MLLRAGRRIVEPKKKKNTRLVVTIIILLLAAAAAAVFFILRFYLGRMNYLRDEDVTLMTSLLETETEPVHAADVYHVQEVKEVPASLLENTITFLIVGTSAPEKEGEEQRPAAQAVITMTINHNHKQCYFCNYNVHTYVDIPGVGSGSLAQVYAIGGGPKMSETIQANYGIPIDHYAAISMSDVAEVINMPEFETLDVSTRGLDVVAELIYRLGTLKPTQVASYIARVLPFVTHNMTMADIMKMVLQIPVIVPYYSERYQIPLEGMYRRMDGYLVPDIGPMSAKMQQCIYMTEDGSVSAEADTGTVLAGTEE